MGNSEPKPKQPQKTLKQQVTESCKQIGKMRRQFQRELYKLQSNDKKMNRELKKLIEKKQPAVNKKTLAQNILKNQRFIKKYQALDAQLQNTQFQLQQMGTMQQMQNVLTGMAAIMGNGNKKFKTEQFTKVMKTYTTQKQKMEMINQMVGDSMEFEDDIDDGDVDNLIRDAQSDMKNKQAKQLQMEGEVFQEPQ